MTISKRKYVTLYNFFSEAEIYDFVANTYAIGGKRKEL